MIKKTVSKLNIVSPTETETLLTLSAGIDKVLTNKSIVNIIEKTAAEFDNNFGSNI